MPSVDLKGGIRLTAPDTFDIVPSTPAAAPGKERRRGPARVNRPVALPGRPAGDVSIDTILSSLAAQDLTLVDRVELQPRLEPTPPSGRRGPAAPPVPAEQSAQFDVDLAGDEGAAVLVEQDGMYTWVLPSAPEMQTRPGTRGLAPGAVRSVRFEVPIRATRPAGPEPRRGLLGEILFDRVKAYVFKYVARLAVEKGIRFLERHVAPGIVPIRSADSTTWLREAEPAQPALPDGRAARVLLFVHGTFSSTVGGFGALGATPWGRAALAACFEKYDAVLGFDHRTLSEEPRENARQILAALRARSWGPLPPRIDAIAHSRGGLVLRSLIEQELPASDWKAEFGAAVLVGATNNGTELARYENWKHFADLYTNLAVMACRALSLVPSAGPVSHVLKEVISSVGALVKYLASGAVEDKGIPGLAAMEPGSDCITALNTGATAPSIYYVIGSEFAARILGEEAEPKEIPLRFAAALAEGLVDQIMRNAANDLVVNTASMSAVHPDLGNCIRDALSFGRTPQVYHTNYFSRPEVANALARWLELPKPQMPQPSRTLGIAKPAPAPPSVLPPSPAPSIPSGTPAGVDTDVLVTPASASLDEVMDAVRASAPSYVIVKRPHENRTLHYAFTPAEIARRAYGPGSAALLKALGLHESESAPSAPLPSVTRGFRTAAAPPLKRTVVLQHAKPVGVLPAADEELGADIAELARKSMAPADAAEKSTARRAMPTFTTPSEPPPTATCHFHAEMKDSVLLGKEATVTVNISREALVRAAGRASRDSGPIQVDPTRKLLIQVFPKSGFELLDDDAPIERIPPEPGQPDELYFRVRATMPGPAEVWVVIRQRQVPLATLKLYPEVVQTQAAAPTDGGAGVVADSVHSTEAPATGPLHRLTILEQRTPEGTVFHFELASEALGILKRGKSNPLVGDRQKYVDNIYRDIESRWISSKGQAQDFQDQLQEVGVSLFRRLLPEDLQKALWEHRNSFDSIFVVSEEPFIPWELVHLAEPGKPVRGECLFLAQMGLVRWLYEADHFPKPEIHVRPNRAWYVIPNYPDIPSIQLSPLPEAEKEAGFLIEKFEAAAVAPDPATLRQILTGPGAFDLLHFACHGMAADADINEPQLLLQGELLPGNQYQQTFLRADTVESRANLVSADGNRPMVVVNACQAGRATYKLTGIGGFAQAFLRTGAGCFVGTLWSVGDSPARTFTESFYSALLDGDDIATATKKARTAAQTAGDATWLSYVVYGHPHAHLVKG